MGGILIVVIIIINAQSPFTEEYYTDLRSLLPNPMEEVLTIIRLNPK